MHPRLQPHPSSTSLSNTKGFRRPVIRSHHPTPHRRGDRTNPAREMATINGHTVNHNVVHQSLGGLICYRTAADRGSRKARAELPNLRRKRGKSEIGFEPQKSQPPAAVRSAGIHPAGASESPRHRRPGRRNRPNPGNFLGNLGRNARGGPGSVLWPQKGPCSPQHPGPPSSAEPNAFPGDSCSSMFIRGWSALLFSIGFVSQSAPIGTAAPRQPAAQPKASRSDSCSSVFIRGWSALFFPIGFVSQSAPIGSPTSSAEPNASRSDSCSSVFIRGWSALFFPIGFVSQICPHRHRSPGTSRDLSSAPAAIRVHPCSFVAGRLCFSQLASFRKSAPIGTAAPGHPATRHPRPQRFVFIHVHSWLVGFAFLNWLRFANLPPSSPGISTPRPFAARTRPRCYHEKTPANDTSC
jgi:hypothetical protein